MFVIRRRAGEAIVLGGDVEIEVVEISRTRVKLAIKAPRSVSVIRRETISVASENRVAAELLSSPNMEGVNDLLRLLQNVSACSPKVRPQSADM